MLIIHNFISVLFVQFLVMIKNLETNNNNNNNNNNSIYTNKAKMNLLVCLRVCPKWPAMPCMEWLAALGIEG